MPEVLRFKSLAILGFPDYRVSDTGIVQSRKVYGSKIGSIGPWWDMKLKRHPKHRYWYVDLFREVGKPERFMVHWLVLEAFIGPRPKGELGRHKDDDPDNNNLTNLEWGTQSDNVQDAIRNGGIKVGEKSHRATLTNDQIREIRRLAALGMRRKKIGEMFGKGHHYITKIVTREIWTHV